MSVNMFINSRALPLMRLTFDDPLTYTSICTSSSVFARTPFHGSPDESASAGTAVVLPIGATHDLSGHTFSHDLPGTTFPTLPALSGFNDPTRLRLDFAAISAFPRPRFPGSGGGFPP